MMKCSDCELWKTEECKNNLEAKDLDYAETFACFVQKEEQTPIKSQRTYKANISKIGLILWIFGIIGFGLSVMSFFGGMCEHDIEGLGGVLLGIFGGFISTVLFLVGLALWLGWFKFK
jgi:hypothetical protein